MATDDEATGQVGAGVDEAAHSDLRATVAAMSNTVALRGVVGVVAGGTVLLLPTATTAIVTLTAILLLGASGIADLVYAVSGRRWIGRHGSRWLAAPRGLAALALCAAMGFLAYVGAGEVTLVIIVGLLGLYVGFRGALAIIGALLGRRERDPLPELIGGAIALVGGILAYTVPSSIVSAVIVAAATAALVGGFVLIAWSLRRASRGTGLDPASASIPDILWDWIEGSDIGRKERADQSGELYFEHPARLTKLGTWWVMLLLSVAIATFAVLADSTAVVIGAMLVAPLMTPILGLAGGLVNGWGRRAIQSAVLVISGALLSILLAYGIAAWAPVAVNFSTNSQIVSRVSPNTIDMLIALAAGAAGAFATVNARVASGIAGVAIAVALVPPLAVVGVSLNGGRFADAGGASLLFLTNFVAIVLAAALVFVITGFARPYALKNRPRQILQTVAPFVILAGLILLPLMLTSESLLQTQARQSAAQETVEDWLGEDSEFIVTSVTVSGEEVSVTIRGPGDPPSAADLSDALQDDFVKPIGLELTVMPVEITTIPAPD